MCHGKGRAQEERPDIGTSIGRKSSALLKAISRLHEVMREMVPAGSSAIEPFIAHHEISKASILKNVLTTSMLTMA
jgi:hypothetical protein